MKLSKARLSDGSGSSSKSWLPLGWPWASRSSSDVYSDTRPLTRMSAYQLPTFNFPPLMAQKDGRYWCRLCEPGTQMCSHEMFDMDTRYSNLRLSLDGADPERTALHRMSEEGSSADEDDGASSSEDEKNIVTWDGPDDMENPKNWPNHRKWVTTLIVSSFTFISPVSSTMVAPALSVIAEEFNIKSSLEEALVMSIFLLAYAIGPFVLAPLSEMYGRVIVLQSANMLFLVFNTACGFATSKQQLMAFRFLSGLGGAAPQSLGGGVLSDCWTKEERGKSISIYSLAPFLGPAVGPIAGGFIAEYSTWRWGFWSVSIADCLVQIIATLFLKETYAPRILKLRADRLRKETGNSALRTEWENPDHSFGHVLRKNIVRPLLMLTTQPVIQAFALYRAYLYGVMYLLFATFPMIWKEQYNYTPSRASLNYASLGIGFVIGIQICGPLNDRIYAALKRRYASDGVPEFRIPLMLPGGLIVPVGLLIYGWAAHFHTHWVGPNIGAALFATGVIIGFQCVQAYVVDSYPRYAASATGALAFLRTMAGFAFPLFAGAMYDRFGVGWGNTLLAGISGVLGTIGPILFWLYGEKLRRMSQYCAG